MRSLLRVFSRFAMCGLLSFAFVALSPSVSHAEIRDATENVTSTLVRLTERSTSNFGTSDLTTTPVASTDQQGLSYLHAMQVNTSSTGTANPDLWVTIKSWSQPSFGNTNVMYQANRLATGTIVQGQKFKVLSSNLWEFSGSVSGSYQSYKYQSTMYDVKYWCANQSSGGKQQLIPDADGWFTAPYDIGWFFISFRCGDIYSLSNYDSVTLMRHGLVMYLVDYPEETLRQIVNNQTEELKDVSGSSTVADEPLDEGTEAFENMPVNQQLGEIATELSDAVVSQEESGEVTFPGLSLMGFVIPAQTVDVWDYLPDIQPEVRWITTFLFVAAFLRYLHDLVDSIFGTGLQNTDGETE